MAGKLIGEVTAGTPGFSSHAFLVPPRFSAPCLITDAVRVRKDGQR